MTGCEIKDIFKFLPGVLVVIPSKRGKSRHAIRDSASPRPEMYWTLNEICKKETGF